MSNNLFYYSTNTYLSYYLSKTFYDNTFFVWCSPVFDPRGLEKNHPYSKIPQSSSPNAIYRQLKSDVETFDCHSSKVNENKAGLKRGAMIAWKDQVITDDELSIIQDTIDSAVITDFKPLLYIIPKSLVQPKVELVPVKERANPLSVEYRIRDLKLNEFEILEF